MVQFIVVEAFAQSGVKICVNCMTGKSRKCKQSLLTNFPDRQILAICTDMKERLEKHLAK
jgi:hypothetical protein